MTVIDTEDTGSLEIFQVDTPKVNGIVSRLADPVWTLIRAGKLDAALVLLAATAEEFDTAWREELVGIPTVPGEVVTPADGCTSMSHAGRDCASALAEGLLAEGVAFCEYCSEQQLEATPAPIEPTETGTIVHIVTNAGTKRRQQGRKVG